MPAHTKITKHEAFMLDALTARHALITETRVLAYRAHRSRKGILQDAIDYMWSYPRPTPRFKLKPLHPKDLSVQIPDLTAYPRAHAHPGIALRLAIHALFDVLLDEIATGVWTLEDLEAASLGQNPVPPPVKKPRKKRVCLKPYRTKCAWARALEAQEQARQEYMDRTGTYPDLALHPIDQYFRPKPVAKKPSRIVGRHPCDPWSEP